MSIVHKLPRALYVCHYCGKGFGARQIYERHLEVHTLGKFPYECYHCGKRFQGKTPMTHHILRLHAKIRDFKCDECAESFPTQAILLRHKYKHEQRKKVTCDICGSKMMAASLDAHKRHVHADGQTAILRCDKCDYTTTYRHNFRKHKNNHLSEADKPFRCSVCNKGFPHHNTLRIHMMIHTDTRPFKCAICEKAFRFKPDLVAHLRLHTGEKPYEVCIV